MKANRKDNNLKNFRPAQSDLDLKFSASSLHVINWLNIRSNSFSLNMVAGCGRLNNLGWSMIQSSFYSCSVLHSQVLSYDIIIRKCTVCSDLFNFSGIILAGFPHRILPLREGGWMWFLVEVEFCQTGFYSLLYTLVGEFYIAGWWCG